MGKFLIVVIVMLVGSVWGEEVRMRGFLYEDGGQWVLASEPNLRKCCLGKAEKVVVVGDNIEPSMCAVEVEGKLVVGEVMRIENARVVKRGGKRLVSFAAIVIVIGLVIIRKLWKR